MFDENAKRSILKVIHFYVKTYLYYNLSFKKKFTQIKGIPRVWGVWNIHVFGPNISLGKDVIFFCSNGSNTSLTSVKMAGHEGSITIGNDVLIMNGVRISSATAVEIGDDCMLANFCYLTDADWHDIYNRGKVVGRTSPIILEKGVWIGDSAIICKGVRIGMNSIIGAGAVVTKDIPPNVVAAGNPARVVKELDPEKIVAERSAIHRL